MVYIIRAHSTEDVWNNPLEGVYRNLGGFQNWKSTVRSLSAENNLPCSIWNYHNHLPWKEEISKTQEDQRWRFGCIFLVINNTAKDEQHQSREMQNIWGQNKETASCIYL